MLRVIMESENAIVHTAGGYGPPGGGGGYPPGGGYGGPPPMGGPPPGGFGAPPPGGGYGQPPPNAFGGGPPGGYPPPAPMGPGGDVNTTLTMILAIVTLVCCGCGTPLGIVSLVMVMNANKAKQTGDLATAQAKNKQGLIWAIIGMVVGLIMWTAVIILNVAANNHAF